MRCRVMENNGLPSLIVDFGSDFVAGFECSFLHFAYVRDGVTYFLCIDNDKRRLFRFENAGVADLAAAFCIKRS